METRQIRHLLEKYFEGNTSLEEERILALYFHGDQIAEEFARERLLFRELHDMKQEMNPDLQFTDLIDKAIKGQSMKSRRHILPAYFIRIAAGFLVLVALSVAFWLFRGTQDVPTTTPALADTYTDPQKAYEETKRALMLVSARLNQGKSQLSHLSHFNQGMQQLNSLGFYLVTDFKTKENEKR